MMTLRLEPSAYELARLYDGPESRFRFDRRTLFAGSVVTAGFAVLGLFFATQTFEIPPSIFGEDPIVITMPEIVPPPPPPEPVQARAEPSPVRDPVVFDPLPYVEPLPSQPAETPASPIGPIARLDPAPAPSPGPATAGPAPVAAPAPRAKTILRPDWLRRPNAYDMADYYPPRAVRQHREGTAVIACTVTEAGGLTACSVAGETPSGWGFGEAALRMAPLFRMRPQTEDGVAVGGARINVPVDFRLQ